MKKKSSVYPILIVVLILGQSVALCGADGKSELVSVMQKESYSLGYEFGGNLKRQTLDVDLDVIMAGIRDAYVGKQSKLAPEEMTRRIKDLKRRVWTERQKKYQELAAANFKAGQAFLAANAKRKGVMTLSSGLQYRILHHGTGPVPKATDSVTVHYRGTLIDGTEIDNSYARGKPSIVHVFGVIQGWREALQLMQTGARWRIFVPSKLAYAKRQFGRIPPNSALIFDLELLSVAQVPIRSSMDPQLAGPESEIR